MGTYLIAMDKGNVLLESECIIAGKNEDDALHKYRKLFNMETEIYTPHVVGEYIPDNTRKTCIFKMIDKRVDMRSILRIDEYKVISIDVCSIERPKLKRYLVGCIDKESTSNEYYKYLCIAAYTEQEALNEYAERMYAYNKNKDKAIIIGEYIKIDNEIGDYYFNMHVHNSALINMKSIINASSDIECTMIKYSGIEGANNNG